MSADVTRERREGAPGHRPAGQQGAGAAPAAYAGGMDSEKSACPVCGQAVEQVVRRHKTLGAWVPLWVPGPCRNPQCEAYPGEETETAGHHEQRSVSHVARRP